MALIVRQFISEKNTLIRGLAHPFIFRDQRNNDMRDLFTKFGAVEVSSNSIFQVRLLKLTFYYIHITIIVHLFKLF